MRSASIGTAMRAIFTSLLLNAACAGTNYIGRVNADMAPDTSDDDLGSTLRPDGGKLPTACANDTWTKVSVNSTSLARANAGAYDRQRKGLYLFGGLVGSTAAGLTSTADT